MAVKLRLQRHGRKGAPFYHIVVADARAPRDGKFIERIGSYNPVTNPATIEINSDKAIQWLENGAQPTETVRAILSYKGILYRRHLLIGVKKGAITQEQADAKYQEWMESKSGLIDKKKDGISSSATTMAATRLAAETKVKEAKEKANLAKIAAAEAPEVTEEEVVAEETAATEEEVATEETIVETEKTETPTEGSEN